MTEYSHLAEALAAAQGEMTAASKDANNPHFRSSFASLASVWAAVRGPLSSNGLAVIQPARVADGMVHVETVIMWRDQRVSCDLSAKPAGTDPQKVGSAITYLRRYGLMAMCGIAPDDDDDGNHASQPPPRRQQRQQPARQQPQRRQGDDYASGANGRAKYFATIKDLGLTHEVVKAYLLSKEPPWPLPRVLTADQMKRLLDHLKENADSIGGEG